MMCPEADNPASCEIRAVTSFFYDNKKRAAKIHPELCAVYGLNVMSERTVRQWCRMFKDGKTLCSGCRAK
jgi:hypothetical protein